MLIASEKRSTTPVDDRAPDVFLVGSGGVSWSSYFETGANMFFLVLFPLFYVYHFLVGSGAIPAFWAGWFGRNSLLAALLLGPTVLLAWKRTDDLRARRMVAGLCTLIGVSALVAVWHYATGDRVIMLPAVEQYLAVAVAWVATFGVGLWMRPTASFLTWLKLLFLVMVVIAWTHTDFDLMMFIPSLSLPVKAGVASYQGLARSIAVTAAVILAFESRRWQQLLSVFIGTATLFIQSARSEFVGFVLIASLWLGMLVKQREHKFAVTAAGLLALFAATVLLVPSFGGSRQLQLLDIASESSWRARQEALVEGWESIKASPLLGDFGGHIRDRGPGWYIHNGLSAWRQFGLLGFLAYAGMLVAAWIWSLDAVFRQNRTDGHAELALYVTSFSLLLSIFSKSVYWVVPGLGWGLAAALTMRRRSPGSSAGDTDVEKTS